MGEIGPEIGPRPTDSTSRPAEIQGGELFRGLR